MGEALRYDDRYIKRILLQVKTIAAVGLSANDMRPSYFAALYLRNKGYRVIPVNPRYAGEEILGEQVMASLDDLETPPDMVQVFRRSEEAPGVVEDAIRVGAKVLWMQLGVRHDEAGRRAEAAGLEVVMDRCPKIEYGRLFGEIGWIGVNKRTISAKRGQAVQLKRPKGGLRKRNGEMSDGTRENDDDYGFETLAIHAGATPDPTTGARATPIYQTTSFVFDDVDHAASLFNLQQFGNIYTRLTNPTVSALEERVAALEGGTAACATASGHSAQFIALLNLMRPGDEMISSQKLYGGSITQFAETFPQFGWHVRFADPTDPSSFEALVTEKTRAIFIESTSNPDGVIADIEAISAVAKRAGVPLICDNTMPSPYLFRPLKHGVDIVIHSMTKYLGGHGNSMGGIIVDGGSFDWYQSDKFPLMTDPTKAYHGVKFAETFGDFGFALRSKAIGLRDMGPSLSPFNAFMILTGTETLPLRMQRHAENALEVATYLNDHPAVAWVSYPGPEGSPYHALAKRLMPRGTGAVFTIGLKGGYEAGVRLVEACELFSHLANIGDTRSLIIHPASTTHRQLDEAQQKAAGAGPEVVRLSIGIETVEDIIADLDQALTAAAGSGKSAA